MDGRYHLNKTIREAAPAGVAAIVISSIATGLPAAYVVIMSIVSVLYAVLVSPDLDQVGDIHSQYILKRLGSPQNLPLIRSIKPLRAIVKFASIIVGGVIGNLWEAIWYPYATYIPHRNFFSHAPVVGTIIRFLYLVVVISCVASMLTYTGAVLLETTLFVAAEKATWLTVAHILSVAFPSDLLHWMDDDLCSVNPFTWFKQSVKSIAKLLSS